jgi:hypothetical protein
MYENIYSVNYRVMVRIVTSTSNGDVLGSTPSNVIDAL